MIYPASDRVSLTTGVRDSCYGSLLLLDKYSKYFQCIQLHTLAFFLVRGRLKRCKVHRVLLSNIKFLFVLVVLPGTVSYPSQMGSSLAQGPLLNSVAQLPTGEATVVQPPQLAGTAAGPYKHHALSWGR